MSFSWINLTPRLKAGINLLNSVEHGKLRLLLNRIVAHMQQDQNGINGSRIFTEDEESKLEKSLSLSRKDVNQVLDTLFFIMRQAAYHKVKPESLHNKLEGLCLEQERASVIASLWSSNAGTIIENLQRQSVLPQQLADVSWMLMVETSSDSTSKKKEPVALLELSLNSCDDSNPKVQLKTSQHDLQQLYHKLEHIQSQLDSLK